MAIDLNHKNPEDLKKNFWVIWGALLFSVFIHMFLAYQNVKQTQENPSYQAQQAIEEAIGQPLQPKNKSNFIIFFSLSLVAAAASFLLKKLFHTSILKNPNLSSMTAVQYFSRLFPGYVVSWALSESTAIFGLILTFSTKNFSNMLPFAALAIVLLIIHRPNLKWPLQIK